MRKREREREKKKKKTKKEKKIEREGILSVVCLSVRPPCLSVL